ncbi:hypothetical protein EJ06DRAFT_359628 [Trichodelitschia bisporula]|uniref:DRBM domain-containing protein n=1 Tax=Trichodelitschia bisporula TaxID=703511 RepID=A0A6G1I0G9_9PEZI|nr:hypothetical protein EJ06DRAFT_359628 [Trichodelitschia bisporula]
MSTPTDASAKHRIPGLKYAVNEVHKPKGPEPIPIGDSASPGAADPVSELTTITNRRGIRPVFEYTTTRSVDYAALGGVVYGASLTLGEGTVFNAPGPFRGKKDAKRAVATQGVEYFKSLPPAETNDYFKKIAHESAVVRLHHIAQRKGMPLDFKFEAQGDGFTASLTLGEREVTGGLAKNKKEAKEAVAKIGLEALGIVDDPGSPCSSENTDTMNWMGKLVEYCQASRAPLPVWQDYNVGPRFSSEVRASNFPDLFGDKTEPFKTKKEARQNAARLALMWLKEQGHVGDDYVSKKSKPPVNDNVYISRVVPHSGTSVERLRAFCQKCGIPPPVFKMTAENGHIYSGGAYFLQTDWINGDRPVGLVRHVYGQKAAKEACAKLCLDFLEKYMKDLEERMAREGMPPLI